MSMAMKLMGPERNSLLRPPTRPGENTVPA
jgi:hypothetical protein